MAHNYIEDMLDNLRRIKSGGDLNSAEIDQIEALEMELIFFRTFINYSDAFVPNGFFMDKIRKKSQLIVEMLYSVCGGTTTNLNVERLVSHLLQSLEGNTSSRFNYELDDSYLLEYMDILDKNLNDAPRYLFKSEPFLLKEIKTLQKTDRYLKQLNIIQKKMRYLRYLYGSEINRYVDHEKLKVLRTRIQFMAENVGHFCLALWVNEDEDDTFNMESKPPYLLFLVVLVELEMKKIFLNELKASKFNQSRTFKDKKLPKGFSYLLHSLLVYLRNKNLENFPDNISTQNIDVAIEFLLVFLNDVPNCVINGKMLNEDLEKVGGLVGEMLCVNQMLLAGSTIKDNASKIDLCTKQILEKIEDLKAQVETCYKSSKFTPSHEFPTVGGLSFLYSLLKKLIEILKSETGVGFMMKPHIGILEKELLSLTSFFAKVQPEQTILEDHWKCIINLAYEAEVAIDSTLSRYNALWNSFCSLPAIIKELKHISGKVTEMRFQDLSLKPCSVVEPSKHQPIQHNNLMNDEEIVGFENDIERIIDHLIRGTNDELHVLPIVGMGGQGKTTCARKLYNNKIIVSHFDVRAWCTISQTYNRRELLQQICSQVTCSKDKEDDVGELADLLRKSLTRKRCLIVLDDMWDRMAWDDLCPSFRDVGNKSRVVVTTRLKKVGEHVMRHIDLYFLPFLTPDESLKLLQKKVFQQESCPPELQDSSQAVAERCKGLPLVIVLVAGIITKRKMEASWWHEVNNALYSYLGDSEDYSRASMQLSYDNLPDYLRPCLLYMGMFPEDETIQVSTLINLWVAEGFVQNIGTGRSVEEAAEGYLMDLISSNVVMVSKRGYNGNIKYCQVHDVVLHFCLEKSREEKFMLAMKDEFRPLDWNEMRVSCSFSNMFPEIAMNPCNLRSLMITRGLHRTRDLSQIHKLRLLKVLDMKRSISISLSALESLIHLKYLSVKAKTFDIHLPHLETLIMPSSDRAEVVFRKMEKLRHVEIVEDFYWIKYKESSTKLESLRILKRVVVSIDEVDVF